MIGAERASIEFWALGFVSGNNWGADKDYFNGVDASAIWAWLDNYCQAHPFERFSDAVTSLIRERKHASH
jgi:hypothetical protein